MKIYVIYHSAFENTNAFFLSREAAQKGIEKLALENDAEIEDWTIMEIEEGDCFTADFASCA